ncbi:MAG: CopG family transcriptional regulator [Magnetococcales bacterium]|nr:CopG family transcriptional regulator [Magnetococcales bacterium]
MKIWNRTRIMAWGATLVVAGLIPLAQAEEPLRATLYKSPQCGCCTGYAEFLKSQGYAVETENVADMDPLKRSLGVPKELESCHTTRIGGYVVEGHVPLKTLQRLLQEKPAIPGIALAGMPSGVPGMPGPKEKLTIHTLENPPKVYAIEE